MQAPEVEIMSAEGKARGVSADNQMMRNINTVSLAIPLEDLCFKSHTVRTLLQICINSWSLSVLPFSSLLRDETVLYHVSDLTISGSFNFHAVLGGNARTVAGRRSKIKTFSARPSSRMRPTDTHVDIYMRMWYDML
jgi:hypothetical protein